jgi:hypothetical protein
MIRKSPPSGHDPMGGHRFSEKDQAQTKSRGSAITIQPEFIALKGDYLAYCDLISRQRAARSPVKASRRSSVGQALPR